METEPSSIFSDASPPSLYSHGEARKRSQIESKNQKKAKKQKKKSKKKKLKQQEEADLQRALKESMDIFNNGNDMIIESSLTSPLPSASIVKEEIVEKKTEDDEEMIIIDDNGEKDLMT